MNLESSMFAGLFILSALVAGSLGQVGIERTFLKHVIAGDAGSVAEMLRTDPKLTTAQNEKGQSALILAIYYGRKEIVPIILKAGQPLNIFEAAAAGQTGRAKELIAKDKSLVNSFSRDGFHPLGLAIFFGHTETAFALLDAGANVNLASRESMRVTPLHSAVAADRLELARELICRGANVNATAELGLTALHEAASRGNLEMAKLLVNANADVYMRSTKGKTPIDLATGRGKTEMAAFLFAISKNK